MNNGSKQYWFSVTALMSVSPSPVLNDHKNIRPEQTGGSSR